MFCRAFSSFAAGFEVENRIEAIFWRSGLQLLIDDFPSTDPIHAKLSTKLLQSDGVLDLEELIRNTENFNSWGSTNEVPRLNMHSNHIWQLSNKSQKLVEVNSFHT